MANQIAGDERHFAQFARSQVAGPAVYMYAQSCRIEGAQLLPDESP